MSPALRGVLRDPGCWLAVATLVVQLRNIARLRRTLRDRAEFEAIVGH